MTKRIIYKCQVCGKESDDYLEIFDCELHHLNISKDVFYKWKVLKSECQRKGQQIYYCKNADTENDFDYAISNLVAFETRHKLTNKHIPDLM